MTIRITEASKAAFVNYMEGIVDHDFLGTPITRRQVGAESIVTFAAGYQAAAEQAPQPTELTDAEIDEITAHCHDGRAYPMDAMMLPILLRRAEARAVLAAQVQKGTK
jgi:hypothetical protein